MMAASFGPGDATRKRCAENAGMQLAPVASADLSASALLSFASILGSATGADVQRWASTLASFNWAFALDGGVGADVLKELCRLLMLALKDGDQFGQRLCVSRTPVDAAWSKVIELDMHAYLTLAQSLTFGSILYRPGHGVVDARRAAQTLAFYRDVFRSEPPVALWTVGAADGAANAAFSADILTPPPAKRPRDSHNGLESAPAAPYPSPAVAPLLSSSRARELKLRELVYDTVLASPEGSVSMSDLIALVKAAIPGDGDEDLAGDIERVCAPDSGGKSPLCFADGNVSLCFTEAGAGKGETTSSPTEFSVKHFIYDIVFASDNGIVPIDQLLAAVLVERPDAYRGYDNLLKAQIKRCRMHDEEGKLLMYFSYGCYRLTDIAMRLAKKAAATPLQEGRAEELAGAEAHGGSGPAAKHTRARKPKQWYDAMRALTLAKEKPSDEELLRVNEMHGGGDAAVTLLAAQCYVLERRKTLLKSMADHPTPAPAMAPAPPVVEAMPEAQAPIPVAQAPIPVVPPATAPPSPLPSPRSSLPPKKQEEPQLFALKPTKKVLSTATAPVTAAPKLKPASAPASAPVAAPAQTAPAQQAPSRLPGALAGLAGGARSLLVKLSTKSAAPPPAAAAQPQEDGGHAESPDGGLFRGVYHHGGKFHSQVFKDAAFLYVGAYSTAEEAARAHDDLSRKLGLDERQMNYPAANYPAAGILREPPAAPSPARDKQPSVEIDPDEPFRLQMHNPSLERELYFAVGVTPTTKLEKVMRAVARKLEAPVTSFELLHEDTKILLVGETVNDAQLDAVHNQVLIRHISKAE